MYRRNINKKAKCGQQTGKALSNHESFSPSQSLETVPLKQLVTCHFSSLFRLNNVWLENEYLNNYSCFYYYFSLHFCVCVYFVCPSEPGPRSCTFLGGKPSGRWQSLPLALFGPDLNPGPGEIKIRLYY